MSTNTHSARRRWIRRGSIFLGTFLAAVLGLAAALYTGTAPIDGGAKSAKFGIEWTNFGAVNFGENDQGMSCVQSVDDQGRAVLDITNAYPGGHCSSQGQMQMTDGSPDGKIVGLDLTLPEGWTAKLTRGCGATVAANSTVSFEVRMGETAKLGEYTQFAVNDGVKVAPASEDAPLQCQQ